MAPESVTLFQLYLERVEPGGSGPASPVEFACLLLYREREYRSMYSSSWRPDRLPAAGEDGPFTPYGLTHDAAAAIAATVRITWGAGDASAPSLREDLFGLKTDALNRLRDALHPQKTHAFGYLVSLRLASDLCGCEDAIALARAAATAGADAVTALALEREAAFLAPAQSPFRGAREAAAFFWRQEAVEETNGSG